MELLIRIVPKNQPDPDLAAKCMPVGGVIAAMPDGHPWSVEERTNPEWRIVKVPILQTHADQLTAMPNPDTAGPRDPRKRIARLDLAKLPADVRAARTSAIVTIPARKTVQDATIQTEATR